MLVTGVCLSLLTLLVLAGLVGELLIRLEVLEVRVEHKNERELQQLKDQLTVLETRLENLGQSETNFQEQIEMLTRRIDGLQEAFKTGDVKYLVSEAQHVRASHLPTFLFLVMSLNLLVPLF